MKMRHILMLVVAGLVIATTSPALTQDQRESYSGLAQHLGTGPTGETPIEIVITRWSTVEEAQKLVDVLVKDGHEKLADALADNPETGFLRFPGAPTRYPSVRLHYARQFQQGDKRTIMLATNRPVGFLEAAGNDRSLDYDLSMIQIEFDGDAKGTGVFVVGADIEIDDDTQKLTVESMSTQPARLTNLEKR